MRYLRRFAALNAAERRLLVRAVGALALFRVGLHLVPFPRLKTYSDTAPLGPNSEVSPAQIALAIARARRLVPRSTCLVQALAAQRLLHQQGYASSLHVGVKPSNGQLLAHAWVECAGETVVGGEEAALYTPILRPKKTKTDS